MGKPDLKLALGYQLSRVFPPQTAGVIAKSFQDSGVVDEYLTWDQLTSWAPRALFNEKHTPLASVVPDTDSFPDAFILAAIANAHAPELGLTVTTDAIRRGPAELMQTMLTLAAATEGKATLLLGAGEIKQTAPYGYDRRLGLKRLEDHLRCYQLFWESDGLINFQGNDVVLTDAWIGAGKPHRPKIFALGGGPKLIELATKYADGVITAMPCVFSTPEEWEQECIRVRKLVEQNGRDPDAFTMGFFIHGQLHDDVDFIKKSWESPLMKWQAAIYGRFNQRMWAKENIKPVMPDDFHYALKLLPARMTEEECLAITDQVTTDMMEKSFVYGSPKDVASQLAAWVEAGADWIAPFDMLPAVVPVEDAARQADRSVEVCRLLKQL